MKDIVILGNNDFGRLLKYYLETDDERKVLAFTVSREYIKEKEFCGLPVVPFEQIEELYPPEQVEILLAIGNSKMNEIRKKMYGECKEKGYTVASYIHSSCSIHTKDIGEGNILLENCLLYPYSKLGNGNLLWDHVLISHDCVVGDFNTFSSYADLCGYVKIGNNGYFGKHCILNDFMEIADYTLIGAAAYAKGKTNPYDVVVPARSVTLEHKKSTDLM
ncbi:MAG: acetyltransferase [Bacteroidales bacterium]|nr:acetyltransferase [Clostridium sp.]MCM1202901.1 acetyltransferase [Bacteroidales bacterium]